MRLHSRGMLILVASIAMQLCLGGIYAWSAMVGPLQQGYGLSSAQTQLIFGVTIATFTLVMVWAGRQLACRGPRWLGTLGGGLFALGYLVAAYSGGQYLLLLLGIGVLAGAGIGCAYVCPLTTAMRWFPDRKGLVTGLTVAGFGAGAIVLSALTDRAFAAGLPVLPWFAWIGLGYGLVVVLCAQALALPDTTEADAPPAPAFWRERPFWGMALGMFCGTFAGLLVIGNLKPLALAVGLPDGPATLAISLFALGNAAGRIGGGAAADRLGAARTVPGLLALGVLALLALALLPAAALLPLTVLVAISFGGCFIVFAAQVAARYGPEQLGHVYPWIFLAYGLAALVGPAVGGWLYDTTASYTPALLAAAAACGIGLGGYLGLTKVAAPRAPVALVGR